MQTLKLTIAEQCVERLRSLNPDGAPAAADLAATGRVPGLDKAIGDLIHFYPADRKIDVPLSENTVSALYSKNLHLSFSGLEEYVECPFRFFLHRGLRIEETEIVEFNSRNIGTFIHKGLERLLMENDVTCADSKTVQKYVDAISEEYYEDVLRDCKNRSRRFDYLFAKAKDAFSSAAENVVAEIQKSDFKPVDFEVDISEYIPPRDLGGGYSLTLVGSIDRVDSADTDNGKLARIIDYKSGPKSFSVKKIYNGHSMQLPIYAGAIRSKYSDVTIAALYYIEVGVPIVKGGAEGMNDDDYREMLDACYTRDGVFLEGDSLEMLKKSGVTYKITKNNVIDSDGMNALMDHAMSEIYRTGCEITSGNTAVSPLIDSGINACEYCKYGDICKIKSVPENERKCKDVPDDFLGKEVK